MPDEFSNIVLSKELIAALAGALIGGMFTLGGAWLAVHIGLRRLRDSEIQRLRIKFAVDLVACRFVLGKQNAFPESYERFLMALNSLVGLHGDDPKIVASVKEFRISPPGPIADEALLGLIRAATAAAQVPLTAVSDTELKSVFHWNG